MRGQVEPQAAWEERWLIRFEKKWRKATSSVLVAAIFILAVVFLWVAASDNLRLSPKGPLS